MTLGLFVFEHQKTLAPTQLQRTSRYKWASNKPIGQGPRYQFLGEDTAEIQIKGILYPEFTGARANLDILRAMSSSGRAHVLISGYGEILGHYFISQISETQSQFLKDGAAQKIEFTLHLTRLSDQLNPVEYISDISEQIYQLTDMASV